MIDSTQLGAQIINFILLVVLLYRLLYKPVRAFIDQRTEEIEQNIKSAEDNKSAAEALRLDLERQVKDNRQKARQFLNEAVNKAEALQAELIAEAKKDSKALLERAQEEIRLEKEKAWSELKAEVSDLSLLLASKVIHETLDEHGHRQLIEQILTDIDLEKEERL